MQIYNVVVQGMTDKVKSQKEELSKELAEIKELIAMRQQMMKMVSDNAKIIDGYSKHCVDVVNENRANIVEMLVNGGAKK